MTKEFQSLNLWAHFSLHHLLKFKILLVAFKIIHSCELSYLRNLKPVYWPYVLDLRWSPPPAVCTICALCSGPLAHMAPSWWNFPFDLASSSDLLRIFKVRMKTFLFQLFFVLYCVLCLMFRYMWKLLL